MKSTTIHNPPSGVRVELLEDQNLNYPVVVFVNGWTVRITVEEARALRHALRVVKHK